MRPRTVGVAASNEIRLRGEARSDWCRVNWCSTGVMAAVGRSRSPQEKKALSYARDRRNGYGENDKASRNAIRRRKRDPNRADRHRERQVLASAAGGTVDGLIAEHAERVLAAKKSKWYTVGWRKWRDAPLADIVENRLRRRERTGMDDPAVVQARIDRIRRRRHGRD